MYSSAKASPSKVNPRPLRTALCAPSAADQVRRGHGGLPGLIADRGGDPVVVLGEAHKLDPAPTQLEGRRQPNRSTANDEHLDVHDQTLPRQTETSQAIAAVTAMPMLYLTPMIEERAVPAYHALRNLRVSAFGALRSHASVINTQSSSGLAASRVTMTHDKRLPQ